VANLLWWRVLRTEGYQLTVRRYLGAVVPVALPALVAATAVLALTATLRG
jgi:Na+/H+ antiporter NhaD/arsenite permease-like protein